MKRLIGPFLLPPLGPFVLIGLGLVLLRRRPRPGKVLIGLGLASLFLFAQPFVAAALLISLQVDPPLPSEGPLPEAQAIVVLGADIDRGAVEYGGAAVGPLGLQRVRYGAHLAKRSGLPVLVTGGTLIEGVPSAAQLMAQVLAEQGVTARWLERRAHDTRQNARFSASLLEPDGVQRVLLVTHAWHMPRSQAAFEAAGMEVIPAPTAARTWPDPWRLRSYLPSARSLQESHWGLHEWIGRVWYALTR
jgi:uncharacterized SAM-binding protein YcdF (DUF218 family)